MLLAALTGGEAGVGGRPASPELVKRLERAGLIVPLARDEAGRIWVDVDARRQIERFQALIGAGYAERDIALVIGRAERSERGARLELVAGVEHLAAASGATAEDIRRWLGEGLLEPWASSEAGEPLMAQGLVEIARALAALETLDLAAHKAAWVAAARARDGRIDGALRERLGRIEGAVKALKKLIAALDERAAKRPRARLLSRRKKGTARLAAR